MLACSTIPSSFLKLMMGLKERWKLACVLHTGKHKCSFVSNTQTEVTDVRSSSLSFFQCIARAQKAWFCCTDETTVIKKETHERQSGHFNNLEWDRAFHWRSWSLISNVGLAGALLAGTLYLDPGTLCYVRPCGHSDAVRKPAITPKNRWPVSWLHKTGYYSHKNKYTNFPKAL